MHVQINNQQSTINTQQSPGIDPRDYNLFHRYAKPESKSKDYINKLKVYPNPASDIITIEILDGIENGNCMVEIFDVMGKRKMSAGVQISSSKGTLNINGIQKGVYMLKVIDSYGNAKTTRFVIQ